LFTSIRWRLAASYALLVLLSVTLMGALALTIVQNYVGRQESGYLKANAQEIAALANRFLQPQIRRIALEELASTSAFLGDARVKIMDAERGVVADSGDPGLPDDFIWLIPSGLSEYRSELDPETGSSLPIIIPIPSRQRGEGALRPRDLMPLLRELPLGTTYVFARRMPTPWGRRFVFENDMQAERIPGERPSPLRQLMSVTLPIGEPQAPVGWVEMSSPLSLASEALGPVRTSVLLSAIGALVVAVIAGLLFGRTISDPLRSLAGTARRMTDGDLSARASTARRDEIGDLARQFNAMAQSLETSFHDLRVERDSLKRFVADASHELRTPITALSTFNELLQGSAAQDPAARQEFLRESQVQLEKLQWITANLLDLSRLDAGIGGLSLGRHAAADIVETAVAGSRGRAREKGIALTIEPVEPMLGLVCDRQRVEMALANLVTNAVKFVPPGGAVTVSAAEVSGSVRFAVLDNGPGIAADELPLVFERFYRGKNATAEGAGLGLAISQSVARAHGGSLDVASSAGAGSTFTLTLPVTPPPA
jgi:signal transduction histidine kinase